VRALSEHHFPDFKVLAGAYGTVVDSDSSVANVRFDGAPREVCVLRRWIEPLTIIEKIGEIEKRP